ncbi:MAG: hypothetical protein MJ120_00050 [Clostridia bacterium]|nr:hypothetical protein [Clostridia bacterium]
MPNRIKYQNSPIYRLICENGLSAAEVNKMMMSQGMKTFYHHAHLQYPTSKNYAKIEKAVKEIVEKFGGTFVPIDYNRPIAAELKQEKIKAIKSDKVYSDDELAEYMEKHPSMSIAEISRRTNRTAKDILRLVK